MTQERFRHFLQNPDLLSAIPYEELKTLALAYPYAANLWLLLWLKSLQEKHADEARNRATAAVYALNRKRLFDLAVLRNLSPAAAIRRGEDEPAPSSAIQAETAGPEPHLQTMPTTPTAVENTAEEKADTSFSSPSATVPLAEERFSSFAAWASQFHLITLAKSKSEAPPSAERKTATSSAQELAQRSISENPAVASETLARLYAQQGYRDKAIEMYRRLMLLYPEKSAFFAAQIDALTKNT